MSAAPGGGPGIRWLDRLAHDLRGPLAPLQTATYLLRTGKLDAAQQAELLAVIDRQTRRLTGMLDELGDWSRAGQGRLLETVEPCEAAMLLDFACTASGAGRVFADVTAEAQEALLTCDQRRVSQLFNTLVRQAAASSATESARVAMQVVGDALHLEAPSGGAGGVGAAPLLLDQPQVEPDEDGLGLGLVIGRAIAEAHGGRLEVMGTGDQVRLRCVLPLAGPPPPVPQPGKGDPA